MISSQSTWQIDFIQSRRCWISEIKCLQEEKRLFSHAGGNTGKAMGNIAEKASTVLGHITSAKVTGENWECNSDHHSKLLPVYFSQRDAMGIIFFLPNEAHFLIQSSLSWLPLPHRIWLHSVQFICWRANRVEPCYITSFQHFVESEQRRVGVSNLQEMISMLLKYAADALVKWFLEKICHL